MSLLDNGIKQPLRFYDDPLKQNWRRCWVKNGLGKYNMIISPNNTILPFQLRRFKSINNITIFDLYRFNGTDFSFDESILSIIPAPTTDHLSIHTIGEFDQIIWNPTVALNHHLACGAAYVHLSDGVENWYSEVFEINDFDANNVVYRLVHSENSVTGIFMRTSGSGVARVTGHKLF